MTSISSPHQSTTTWVDDTIPRSERFDDTYYSKAGGLAESRRVFLGGNRLAKRLPDLTGDFMIGELGFGTGLNFLTTADLWKRIAPPEAKLHFVSFELFPLPIEDVRRALSSWPELESESEPFLAEYTPDFEFFDYASGNVRLTVFMCDANERLPRMEFAADAWYLDGFAPARNPELWNDELMKEIYAHTGPGGSFATYTAAGWVRRNLQDAGFEVEKQPGFAGKREMMVGYRTTS